MCIFSVQDKIKIIISLYKIKFNNFIENEKRHVDELTICAKNTN